MDNRTMLDSPIFLVGAERSGSTLLRLMLDSHPEITGCEGYEFVVDLLGDDGSYPELPRYWDYLSTHQIFGSTKLEIDRSLDYQSLVNSFIQQRMDLSGKPQAAAMVHFHFGRILHLWPNARFIHMVRDPRDVTASVLQMGWEGNVWFGLNKWVDAETEWDRVQPLLGSNRYLEVLYADLIGDHVGTLQRICEFLEVEYTGQMLDYASDTGYDVPDPTKVNKWNKTLSSREIRLVEGRVGELLVARGFELSGLEPLQPTGVAMRLLKVDNHLKMWKNRIDKFGIRLFVERAVARLVPIESYRRSVKLRFNAIERSTRKQSWRDTGQEFSVRTVQKDQ